MLTLYTTPLSANGRKPLAVVRHLGLSAEVKVVNVYAGEGQAPGYLAINPFGKIPTLVDGALTLWESNAILVHLAEAHGDHRLLSREPARRADVMRWLFWEASAWQPTVIAVPGLPGLVGGLLLGRAEAREVAVTWSDPAIQKLAGFLDGHLRGRRFLAADELTLADLSVAGMLTYARAARFPFEAFPDLATWYGRIEELPAWRSTAAGPWGRDGG